MKLKTYKVLRGYYNEIKEKELSLPEDAVLIYTDGICGDCCHTGHNHYAVILPKAKYPDNVIDEIREADKHHLIGYDEFFDLHILTIRDIKFVDEYPSMTAQEAMLEYKMNEYYVIWKKKDYWSDETIDDLRSGKLTLDDAKNKIEIGKSYRAAKILGFGGPFSITMFIVYTGNYFDDRPTHGMDLMKGCELKNICPSSYNFIGNGKDNVIVTKDCTLFEQLKSEVLYQIDNYNDE